MICISSDGKVVFFGSSCSKDMGDVSRLVSESFMQVKDQFEDHLEAINENTNEIQANFEYLCELDSKMTKLAEKVEELTMLVRQQRGEPESKIFKLGKLTIKEKEVFHALYVLTEHSKAASYKDISRRTGYSENLVSAYITSLIEKGVPVSKKYSGRTAWLGLDPEFREIQTKENIAGINTLLTHWTG